MEPAVSPCFDGSLKVVLGGNNYVDTLCGYVDTLCGLSKQVS